MQNILTRKSLGLQQLESEFHREPAPVLEKQIQFSRVLLGHYDIRATAAKFPPTLHTKTIVRDDERVLQACNRMSKAGGGGGLPKQAVWGTRLLAWEQQGVITVYYVQAN